MAKPTKAEKSFSAPVRWGLGDNGGAVIFNAFQSAQEWMDR